MDLGLEGRVALVAASSRGLGFAVAAALAEEGADVVICGRHESSLRSAEYELSKAGGGVLGVVADVTDPDVPAQLVAAAVERFGRLDILVGNAGGPPPARSLEATDEQLLAALNANLLTSVRLVREAVPHMRVGRWGRICLIGSYFMRQPAGHLALSNTARTALWAWAKTAAADLAPDRITLNLVLPGPHDTERMRELGGSGPMGSPADFGQVVAFLCSEPARNINGAALTVDGGATTALS